MVEVAQGLRPTLQIRECGPAVIEHVAAIRLEAQNLVEAFDGGLGLAQFAQDHGAIMERCEMVRLNFYSPLIVGQSVFQAPQQVVNHAPVVICEVGFRVQGYRAIQVPEGLFEVILVDGLDAKVHIALAQLNLTHNRVPE